MHRVALFGLGVVALLGWQPHPTRAEPNAKLQAYVTAIALNLRAKPDTESDVLGTLLKYDPVVIHDRARTGSTTWYAVQGAGGYLDGWVSAAYIAFGEPPTRQKKEIDYGLPENPTLVKGPFKYVGVAACKKCHLETTGKFPRGAYPVWKGHFHSYAYRSLTRDYTKVIAKRWRGIDDPAHDWRCLKCHVTAYGAEPSQLASTYRQQDGVTCEVCHGPGSEYVKVDHGPGNPDRYKLGFQKLTNLEERQAFCTRCHNPVSPSYKPFNLQEFSRVILHWVDPDDGAYQKFAEETGKKLEKEVPAPVEKPGERKAAEAAVETALKQEAEVEAKAAKERAEAAETAEKSAEKAKGVEHYLAGLPAVLTFNEKGDQYYPVKFSHAAHASGERIPGITCRTCHHTQEGDERPQKCSACHVYTGPPSDEDEEPLEDRAKVKSAHSKQHPFPMEAGQTKVSCLGCHLAQNALLADGKRTGMEAPTSCTKGCHDIKSRRRRIAAK